MRIQAVALIIGLSGVALAVPASNAPSPKRIFPWLPPNDGSEEPVPTPTYPRFPFGSPSQSVEPPQMSDFHLPGFGGGEGDQETPQIGFPGMEGNYPWSELVEELMAGEGEAETEAETEADTEAEGEAEAEADGEDS